MAFAVGALLALALTSIALATHRRPGAGTPFRTALVTAYKQCTAPNSDHVSPLALPSCTPPELESSTLTMGTAGAGHAIERLDVYCTDGQIPPCTPNDDDDTEDILIRVTASDVRCAVGGIPNCTDPGSDYTGQLILTSSIRITDHLNGSPPALCTNGSGNPPCVTATVVDLPFSVPMGCADNGGPNGGACSLTSTVDTLMPNTVIEFQRGVVAVQNFQVRDSGPDGSVTPPPPFVCPPICGSGDETKYLEQGDMYP